jgi:hypothetical protein
MTFNSPLSWFVGYLIMAAIPWLLVLSRLAAHRLDLESFNALALVLAVSAMVAFRETVP